MGDDPEPPAALPAPHQPPAPHPGHPGRFPGAGALGAVPGHGYLQGKGCRPPGLPPGSGGRGGSSGDSRSAQTQGHILPGERINLRHRSFLPAEDLGWHREVTKEAPIAVVSSSLPSLGKLGWVSLSAGVPAEPLPAQTSPLFVLDLHSSLFFRRSWRYVAAASAFPPRPRVEGAFRMQELDGIGSKFLLGRFPSPRFSSVLQISLGPLCPSQISLCAPNFS